MSKKNKENNTEVVQTSTVEEQGMVPVVSQQSSSVESFISQAIGLNVPIETLERLLALRDKDRAEKAREGFIGAMAKFQAECPIIEKKKLVKDKYGKDRYKYAPIDSIIAQVKKALADNGLSYRFDEIKDDKFVTAVCTITHILGHSEQSSFKVEIGQEQYMTDTQKYGARMTFAKRYAFCNALGITTGDEDNDANETDEQSYIQKDAYQPKESITPKTERVNILDYQMKLHECKTLEELKALWSSMPVEAKDSLKLIKDEMKIKLEAAK